MRGILEARVEPSCSLALIGAKGDAGLDERRHPSVLPAMLAELHELLEPTPHIRRTSYSFSTSSTLRLMTLTAILPASGGAKGQL